ncbi:MAG: hypothetical protein AB7P76_09995 [Candidatus Melainabacteria bacterium]
MASRTKKADKVKKSAQAKPQQALSKLALLTHINSLADTDTLNALLEETERELVALQPEIEKLEEKLQKLNDLRKTKQKLITLRLSLKSIVHNFNDDVTDTPETSSAVKPEKNTNAKARSWQTIDRPDGVFYPDLAQRQVATVLRRPASLNAELFRAVVFAGGIATTEQIRDYLVENRITYPTTGQGFDAVPLSEISSRINYLVRKGILSANGRGSFVSQLGWQA